MKPVQIAESESEEITVSASTTMPPVHDPITGGMVSTTRVSVLELPSVTFPARSYNSAQDIRLTPSTKSAGSNAVLTVSLIRSIVLSWEILVSVTGIPTSVSDAGTPSICMRICNLP